MNGEGRAGKRQFIKLDRYALFDVVRENDLTPVARTLLLALVLLADFRSWKWTGTMTDLAQHAAVGRNNAARALKQLEGCGLVVPVRDFGRGSEGVLFVEAIRTLVVPEPRATPPARPLPVAPNGATEVASNGATPRAEIAPTSRRRRAEVASFDATSPGVTCDDAIEGGSQGEKERGSDEDAARTGGDTALDRWERRPFTLDDESFESWSERELTDPRRFTR